MTLTTRVRNSGTADFSGTLTVRAYLVPDVGQDVLLGEASFLAEELPKNGLTEPLNFDVQIAETQTLGTYKVRFEIDPDNQVVESDETDNTNEVLSNMTVVSPPRPDLKLTSSSTFSPKSVLPGNTLELKTKVVNSGTAGFSGTLTIRAHLVPDVGQDVLLGEASFENEELLVNKKTKFLPFQGQIPDSQAPGNYTVRFEIDPDDQVEESIEHNNTFTFTTPLVVLGNNPAAADASATSSTEICDKGLAFELDCIDKNACRDPGGSGWVVGDIHQPISKKKVGGIDYSLGQGYSWWQNEANKCALLALDEPILLGTYKGDPGFGKGSGAQTCNYSPNCSLLCKCQQ